MLAYVFPGQGSQVKGMGSGLFETFKDMTEQADAVLGYSIADLCCNDPDDRLRETQYTQPALYVVNALSYMKLLYDTGRIPEIVAGHSLGEYNALHAAGVFDFTTGLRLVQKRGALMAQARNGGMAAVMGVDSAAVQRVLEAGGVAGVSVANFNAPTQTVISGNREGIDQLEEPFTAANAVYIKLNVSGAFHTPWMRAAQDEFAVFLTDMAFHAPAMPVISNLRAEPYTVATIVDNLLHQISSPVRWTEVVGYLLDAGADEIVEVGPGRVLTGLVDKIRRSR